MSVNAMQLDKLLARYKEIDKNFGLNEANNAQFKLAIDYIYQRFHPYINLNELEAEDKAWPFICQVLEKSLVNSPAYQFDPISADLESLKIKQSMDYISVISLLENESFLGIQEKFLKGTLTHTEALSELDLRRVLELSNTQGKIQLAPFDTQAIATILHAEREKNHPANSVYIIPLLLSRKTAMGQTLWFTATITVDPLAHKISYEINDSQKLSAKDKKNTESLLRDAIAYEATNAIPQGVSISAYPANKWVISGSMKTADLQKNAYFSGYLALQSLFQVPGIIDNNDFAERYSRLNPDDSQKLIDSLHEIQLEHLRVSQPIFEVLHYRQRKNIVDDNGVKRIAPQAIQKFLSSAAEVKDSVQDLVNPRIQSTINKLDAFSTVLRFPGEVDASLSAFDHENFFIGLQLRLSQLKIKLKLLTLAPGDTTVLDGLNAYCGLNAGIDFEKLHLDLEGIYNADEFIAKLKMTLLNLSDNKLVELSFEDKNHALSQQHWQQIADFVANKKIALLINLPRQYAGSPLQRQLDETVSINQRERNKNELNEEQKQRNTLNPTQNVKRKRIQQDRRAALNIDIELQQEQQQEQQVEVAVAAAFNRALEEEGIELGEVRGLRFQDLKRYLSEGRINLKEGADLVSVNELRKNWHQWLGNVVTSNGQDLFQMEEESDEYAELAYENDLVKKISIQACEQLINFRHLFQYGIDFEQLPKGFVLVPDPYSPDVFILHYDKNALQNEITIAPVLNDRPVQEPLPTDVVDAVLAKLDPTNSRDALLIRLYQQLKTNPYSRESQLVFNQYLPKLLSLNTVQLEKLLEMAQGEEGELSPRILSYILNNYSAIDSVFKGNSPASDDSNTKWAYQALLKNIKLANVEGCVQLAHELVAIPPSKEHLLSQLLVDKPALLQLVKSWAKKLSFNESQMDALLQVYSQYDDQGLYKLFLLWDSVDPLVLEQLHKTVFKKADSFIPMMKDEHIQNAIRSISGLKIDANKYHWLSTLLQQHAEQVGYDHLPDLVDSFLLFSKKIDEYALTFYPNISFTNIKSMPTALARMLSILKFCKTEDREKQWQCITALPLQSNAAIRAFTDAEQESEICGFVIPEMLTTPVHYSSYQHYGVDHASSIANISKDDNDVETVDLNASRVNFFRYVAHQKYRLPLSFYQEMDAAIWASTYGDAEKAKLYEILAKNTTGLRNSELCSADLEYSKKCWLDILKHFDQFSTILLLKPFRGMITKAFIEMFNGFENPPGLAVLNQLTKLFTAALYSKSFNPVTQVKELIDKVEKLETSTRFLDRIYTNYEDAVYLGMKFFDDKDYTQPGESLLYRYIYAATNLMVEFEDVKGVENPVPWGGGSTEKYFGIPQNVFLGAMDKEAGAALMSLISHFDLAAGSKEEVKSRASEIRENYRQAIDTNRNTISTAMDLLRYMDKNSPPPLNPKNLNDFILKFTQENNYSDKEIQALVQQHFADYFPPKFFQRLQTVGIPPDISDYLNKNFNADEIFLIENLLTNFSGNELKYMPLIKAIRNIFEDLSSNERIILLEQFNKPDLISGIKIDDFSKLLYTLITQNGANDFSFFITKALEFKSAPVEGLLQKTQMYLNTILPAMKNLKSKVVSKMDSLNLIIELLLAMEAEQLSKNPNIIREDEVFYQQFHELISANPKDIDPKILEQKINDLIVEVPGFASLPQLNRLRLHLQELNKFIPPPSVPKKEAEPPKKPDVIDQIGDFFNKIGGFFKKIINNKQTPVQVVPTLPVIEVKQAKLLDADLMVQVNNELNTIIDKRKEFEQVFVDLFQAIYKTAEHYAGDKEIIIQYLRHFISHNYVNSDQIVFSWNTINLFKNEFIAIDNADVVRSLCNHFNKSEGMLSPGSLLNLLSSSDYNAFSRSHKNLFLNILTVLLNSDKSCTLAELQLLMQRCKADESDQLLGALKVIYESAPYPTIDKILEWQDSSPSKEGLYDHLIQSYAVFDKMPCERESINGFDLNFARDQVKLMGGVDYSEQELQQIADEVIAVRSYSTDEIKTALADFRLGKEVLSNERLLALTAELMYRTNGKPAKEENGKREWGRSFEIHTTQYLAIYSMLKAGGHVTSEIGTGEGKSRIMMLLIACQYAQGKTVDFVTSDVQLATRDYLSFHSFFQALGAKTNIIYQTTPASHYALDGINFSDASNLNLFRNKARSEGQAHKVMVADPKKRALMLDEADKAYYDLADTRFNYSAMAGGSIGELLWVYDLLIEFFSEENPAIMNLYYTDVNACNQLFFDYALVKVGEDKANQLQTIAQAQLEAWQDSALAALALEVDKDFAIKSNIEIDTKKGAKTVSEAHLLIGQREDRHSRFSFGVHQCLHARLNRLRNNPELAKPGEEKLVAQLNDCKHDFFMDPEKQIIYSSTSKSMLDEYSEGTLCAVTGTAGSIREQEEARALYAGKTSDMSFITVPRHRGLLREDYPLYLSANKEAQYKQLVKEIIASRKANQPVTLICENDIESAELIAYLQDKLPANLPHHGRLVRISAQNSSKEEAQHIEHGAGLPGMVTVSTSMIGRGTDISLHDEAKKAGLKVLVTFLPRERELLQIIGRAGRFGAAGESRLILDKEALKKQLGKTTLTDGFYTATETYIKQQQALMDRKAQIERLIKFTVGDFRCNLTNNYFDQFFENVVEHQQGELSRPWKNFFDETDKKWNETWQLIKGEMDKVNPKLDAIDTQLALYQTFVQSRWTDLKNEVELLPLKSKMPALFHPSLQLLSEVGELKLADTTTDLLRSFDVKEFIPLKTPVADKYDPAYDGKAVLYTHSFEKVRAVFRGERPLFADTRAWWNGRGILFPNLRAWWQGAMSFGEFLFGASTKPKEAFAAQSPKQAAALPEIKIQGSTLKMGSKLGLVNSQQAEDIVGDNYQASGTSFFEEKSELEKGELPRKKLEISPK